MFDKSFDPIDIIFISLICLYLCFFCLLIIVLFFKGGKKKRYRKNYLSNLRRDRITQINIGKKITRKEKFNDIIYKIYNKEPLFIKKTRKRKSKRVTKRTYNFYKYKNNSTKLKNNKIKFSIPLIEKYHIRLLESLINKKEKSFENSNVDKKVLGKPLSIQKRTKIKSQKKTLNLFTFFRNMKKDILAKIITTKENKLINLKLKNNAKNGKKTKRKKTTRAKKKKNNSKNKKKNKKSR